MIGKRSRCQSRPFNDRLSHATKRNGNPHAWTMIEADVTNLVMLRNKLKDDFKRKEGVNLTYLAFVLKAVVNAIKDYPIMNSVWAVDKIIIKKRHKYFASGRH